MATETQHAINTMLLEERRYPPPEEFAAQANAQPDIYEREPDEFWGAEARQKIQEAVAEGQKVAGEIKSQAQAEAARRLERAEDEIAREREKAKEMLKEQMIRLSMRTAEKILRQRLDDAAQRRLVGEFIDEVGVLR